MIINIATKSLSVLTKQVHMYHLKGHYYYFMKNIPNIIVFFKRNQHSLPKWHQRQKRNNSATNVDNNHKMQHLKL